MFPVEYVYADWIGWQENSKARRADPESPTCPNQRNKDSGSQVEGFCIPQFMLRKSDIDRVIAFDVMEHWQPDLDGMTENDPFVENDKDKLIPIFTAEHVEDDPRYARLKLTNEWKDHRPQYRNVSFLHHSFLLPSADHPLDGRKEKSFFEEGGNAQWSYSLHGPVRKLQYGGFPNYEADETGVFKYPDAWPEPAMDWLVRPRPNGWPSSDLVQEIFEIGCHLAPVGRGKRLDEPVDVFTHCQNPEATVASSLVLPMESNKEKWVMDETEWRTSFSLAENKLGESVLPVQRHVMVLLKMIKKFYFPDVISTYHLKNLLFWECERKDEVFWKEDNSGSCLLFMLDRLQECLEAHHLPHYIMPQSNLLMYEDPSRLKEAAIIVADVRSNILPKTYSLLRRLQSMTYQSQTYLQDLGLQLEDHLLRMQDRSLPDKDNRELLRATHSVFVRKCKEVVKCLRGISPTDRLGIEKMINIALCVYQSILARNLCKLWFLNTESSNHKALNEKEFKSFVKREAEGLSLYEDFLAVALFFFERARKGVESSLAIPSTSVMRQLREEHMKIAQENIEEANAELKGVLGWLKANDFKVIGEKIAKKIQGRSEGTLVTQEEVRSFFDTELAALFQDRTKDK